MSPWVSTPEQNHKRTCPVITTNYWRGIETQRADTGRLTEIPRPLLEIEKADSVHIITSKAMLKCMTNQNSKLFMTLFYVFGANQFRLVLIEHNCPDLHRVHI